MKFTVKKFLDNAVLLFFVGLAACASKPHRIADSEAASIPTRTNQLHKIAFSPLISNSKSDGYFSKNNEYLVHFSGECSDILIKDSDVAWPMLGENIPNRYNIQKMGEALKADGALAVYLEETGELNAVLLSLADKSVWRKTFKKRENLKVSSREICKAIRKGGEFIPSPIDSGNKVLVLPVIDKEGDELVAKEWKNLVEMKFKSKGYVIINSDSFNTPKYLDVAGSSNNLFVPKDMKLGGTGAKFSKLDIDVSTVAMSSGVDWVAVAVIDRFDYKNFLIFQKETLVGRVEVFDKSGRLIYTSNINVDGQGNLYGYVDVALLASIGYASERLAGKSLALVGPIKKCLQAGYMQLNIPRYW